MNNLNLDILKYNFIKYFTLKERYIISKLNKNFSKICKKSTFYQIGICIAKNIELDFKNLDSNFYKLEILKSYKFDFIKEISKFLLNDNTNYKNFNINTYFSNISLIEINSKTIIECKKIILNRNFLYRSKTNKYNSKYFKINFPNLNSLLLC